MARTRSPFVTLATALAVVATFAACSRPDAPPPPPPDPPDKVEQDLVTEALHACLTLDCERAYAHVSTLPATSQLRRSDAFRAIVYRYYAEQLLRADVEPDPTKRRTMLQTVLDSKELDTSLRLAATERISRIGAQVGAAGELSVNATATAKAEAEAEAADMLAKSRSKVVADQNLVRARVEPKIFAGKATAIDVAMLKNVCKAQKDASCLKQLDHLILP